MDSIPMQKSQSLSYAEIRNTIIRTIPPDIGITRIEFEGPRLAIYTKRPEKLLEQGHIVGEIAGTIKKRIVVRPDPSVRTTEAEAERVIKETLPEDVGLVQTYFDPTLGEVVLEVLKPGVAIGRGGSNLLEIVRRTRWSPNVVRSPPIPSMTIKQIRGFLYSKSKDRERFLRETGESIFRSMYRPSGDVRITFLGGIRHVGRSAILIRTRESSILLDCGVNPGTSNPIGAYPRIDVDEFDIRRLDAVVITHAHLDHCGFLPYLYKYGYDGPVYCSQPTASLMVLLQGDYLDVMSKEGRVAPFGADDIREVILHTIPLGHGEVTDVSPDVRLTLHNAGHILGSSIVHLHIGRGLHNIVYTGDFKFGHTQLLQPAAHQFPRVETLIMESTYGGPGDAAPSRMETEGGFVEMANRILKQGKVLIPVPAVGRAQEILMVINKYMEDGDLVEVPVYIEGMISEATGIHTAYPGYLSNEIRNQILREGRNPFESDYFTVVKQSDSRDEIAEGGPCIIIATAGMMEGGPVIEYFKRLAPWEENGLIFVSYQVTGTMGQRLQSGLRSVQTFNRKGKMEITNVAMSTHTVEGFSGHSDRRQLLSYVRRMRPTPRRVFLVHGEESKCENMARTISKIRGVRAYASALMETVRLA
ncbi:MAG: beta-CASP ribonuclease aCPSF1 [Candidatus Bathyarchaeota archaeon]|nr:beta-CASP ribonuclease aCPSF1 [Candidatus Bathyarchaeota archaeon]